MPAREKNTAYQQDEDLKELLSYIPKTKKPLAKELALWLYPNLKTTRGVKTWIAKQEFWEDPLELRRAAVFIELLDKIARPNNVDDVPGPNVEKLLIAIFAWLRSVPETCPRDIVSTWLERVSPPIRNLLEAVEKREKKELEDMLTQYLERS